MNEDQIEAARAANDNDANAREFATPLRALYGIPEGAGYTAEMIPLIAEYQVSVGDNPANGVVRGTTITRLKKQAYIEDFDCSSVWPAPGSEASSHYDSICVALDLTPPVERPLVLGIRGAYPFARRTHRMIHAMRYDDTFVLLRTGLPPHVFRGATHAYQTISGASPDVNKDGKGDVGSIRPGRFVMELRTTQLPEFHIKRPNGVGDLPAYRDTDHDGVISEAEAMASESATKGKQVIAGEGMVANGVLFHPGYETTKPESGKRYASIACQTAPLPALQLLKQTAQRFDFVLANAKDIVKALGG